MTFAIVFPGQGSQSAGMQRSLAGDFAAIEETYAEASAVLGFDLWAVVQDESGTQLEQTTMAQPAMLAAGVAVWRCWLQEGGPRPSLCAGHSLGEYAALVCAGSLAYPDAVALVQKRAELMQDAVPRGNGAMVAVLGLDDADVIDVCAAAAEGEVVSAANFNAPGQVVIAGSRAAVERAADLAKAAGARRVVLLNVSVPSHCMLMQPAADGLAEHLAAIAVAAPEFAVINNADAAPYATAAQVRDGLRRQLYMPVRWVDTVQRLRRDGATTIFEAGPGKVLAGLTKRIDKGIAAAAIDSSEALHAAIERAKSDSQEANHE